MYVGNNISICRLTVYSKPQPTMEYSKSVEAQQGTERSVLVLPKSVNEDTMRYSIPIQAEGDGRNSMLVASVAHKDPATHIHTQQWKPHAR